MPDNAENCDWDGANEPASFSVLEPEQQMTALVFNSPHSGRYYPHSFIDSSLLNSHTIRQSEDFLVDELFARVVEIGAPLMQANYARAYLDVNREPYELDPGMFAGKLPTFANTKSQRIAGGLGTIARIVADRQEIYRNKLDVEEVLDRVERIYKPYHEALRNILAKTHMAFGYAVLLDCHSMPSTKRHQHQKFKPDFVIGDRYGTSAAGEIVHWVTQILRDLGYKVAINKPYAGGFITEHYGRPKEGLHAIQIEINRGIYMKENNMEASREFDHIRVDLLEFVTRLGETVEMQFLGQYLQGSQDSLAAE